MNRQNINHWKRTKAIVEERMHQSELRQQQLARLLKETSTQPELSSRSLQELLHQEEAQYQQLAQQQIV